MTAAEGSRTPPCGSKTQILGKSECGTWFQGSPGNSGAFGSWWAWLDLWFRARCLTCWDDPCPGIHVTQTLRGPCRVGLRTQRPSFSCSLSTSFLFCECWRPAPVLLGFRRAQDPVLGQDTTPNRRLSLLSGFSPVPPPMSLTSSVTRSRVKGRHTPAGPAPHRLTRSTGLKGPYL